jgi:hypothetical protein
MLDTPISSRMTPVVRAALQRAGVHYQVVYGTGPQRLQGALAALQGLGIACGVPPAPSVGRPWVWVCEKCSDPECEHRLFRGLVNPRPPLRH